MEITDSTRRSICNVEANCRKIFQISQNFQTILQHIYEDININYTLLTVVLITSF